MQTQSAPNRNIVSHGLQATGKTAVARAVLDKLSANDIVVDGESESESDLLRFAIIRSVECITGRHLLENTVGAVAQAVGYEGIIGRCENLSQLAVSLGRFLEQWNTTTRRRTRFVLVFDGIDRQRDAPPTLLPALARLGEIVSCLTIPIQPSLTTLDTKPHYVIYCNYPPPAPASPPRRAAYPFPIIQQDRTLTNSRSQRTRTTAPDWQEGHN